MKKLQLFALVILLMTAFSAKAAPSSEENAIVGSWESAQDEKMDLGGGMVMSMSGAMFSTYNADKTGTVEGSIRLELPMAQEGYTNSFYTDVAISGTFKWSIDPTGIVLTQTITTMNVKASDLKAERDDEVAQMVISELSKAFDQIIPELRQSMMQETKDNILSLNVKEMSLQSATEPNAQIEVWKRVK